MRAKCEVLQKNHTRLSDYAKKVTDRCTIDKCEVLQIKQKASLQHHKNSYYALIPMMND